MGLSPTSVIFLIFLKRVLFPLFWKAAHGVIYHYPCYWPQNKQARWPCGQSCWFKAPVTSVALVWVPLLTFSRHCYTKYCILYIEHLQMVSSTIIHAIDHTTYRQDGRVVWGAGLRHQELWWCGFQAYSSQYYDIPIQSIVSFILNTCTWYLLPFHGIDHTTYTADGRFV